MSSLVRSAGRLCLATLAGATVVGGAASAFGSDPPAGRVAFTRLTEGYWQVWSMSPEGIDERMLTHGPSDKRHPTWSKDGRFLVFADSQGRLFRLEAGGGEATALLPDHDSIAEPDLSSTGRVAYQCVRKDPGYVVELWTSRLDGSDRRLLTRPGQRWLQPAWSADGRRLVAVEGAADSKLRGLVVVGPDGDAPERWVMGEERLSAPCWSPAGTELAYALDREGNNDIWTVRRGKEPVRLTFDPAADLAPAYSPDGTTILFVSRRSGSLQLLKISKAGGAPAAVTHGPAPCREPSWWGPSAHPSLHLSGVTFSRRGLDVGAGETTEVGFDVDGSAQIELTVRDSAQRTVRTLRTEGLLRAGRHNLEWDGRDEGGRPVPAGAYFVRVTARDGVGEAHWDPTAETGGTSLAVRELRLVPDDRSLAFEVPEPAWVRVRVGLEDGPLLATPLDWTPMAARSVTLDYAGQLPPGWDGFWRQPDRHVWVAAYSLPDNAIVVDGSPADPRDALPTRSVFAGSRRDLFPHARHAPSGCRDPGVGVRLESDLGPDDQGLPVVAERVTLIVDALDEADRELLETSRFEVMVFIDGLFVLEEEDSALPFHYTLETSQIPDGRHAFLVNVGGYHDHLGAAFAPFVVRRGER